MSEKAGEFDIYSGLFKIRNNLKTFLPTGDNDIIGRLLIFIFNVDKSDIDGFLLLNNDG